jgi:hypothetical protein
MTDEIQRSLGRLEGKFDQLMESIDKHFEDDKINFASVRLGMGEIRKDVDSLRFNWARVSGMAAFLAFIATQALQWFRGH